MRKKLLFRSWLLLALMLVGVTSSRATTQTVGATDYTTGFNTVFKKYVLQDGYKLHVEFTNNSQGTDSYKNWLLYLSKSDLSKDYLVIRPDFWWWDANGGTRETGVTGLTQTSEIKWDNFAANMNGAYVTMDISYHGGIVEVLAVSKKNGNNVSTESIYYDLNQAYGEAPASICPRLSVEAAYLVIENARYMLTELNPAENTEVYDFNSYVKSVIADGGQMQFEKANNSLDGQSCVSISDDMFKDRFVVQAHRSSGNVDNIYWFLRNQNRYVGLFDPAGGSYKLGVINLAKNDQVTIEFTGTVTISSDNTNVEAGTTATSGTTYTMSSSGTLYIQGNPYTTITKITILRSTQTYSVNYTYGGNTVYTSEQTSGYSGEVVELPGHVNGTDGNTYYNANTPTITIESGISTYSVECSSMEEGLFAFVNAVDANGTVLASFKSATSGNLGDAAVVYIDRVVKYNDQYYDYGAKNTNNPLNNYQVSVNYGSTTTKTYTLDTDIAFYQEVEDFTGKSRSNALGNVGNVNERASGGDWRRVYPNAHAWSDAISDAGYYNVSISGRNQSSSSTFTFSLRLRLSDGTVITPEGTSLSWSSAENSVKTITDLYIPAGASIDLYNDTEYNTNVGFDYVLVKTSSTVAPTLAFSTHAATATITDLDFLEPSLTVTPNTYAVAYTSSDEKIARVNPLTGDVFMLDGTTADNPVTITASILYTANGVTYTVSDSYNLTIKVGDEGAFKTEGSKSTAFVSGQYGKRKEESVQFITMKTGNLDMANDVSLIRNLNGTMVVNTLAGDGWRDVRFKTDGVTPIEGTYYVFNPEVKGTLKVDGLMIGSNEVMFVDADNVTQNLITSPSFVDASTLANIEYEVLGGKTYYLFAKNPYYCGSDKLIGTTNVNVGNSDGSSTWDWNISDVFNNQVSSDVYSVGRNQTLTINFVMHTNGDIVPGQDVNNWLLQLRENDNSNNALFLRVDSDASAGSGGKMDPRYSILEANYEDFYTKTNGAKVKLTISRSGMAVTITIMMECTDGSTYIKQQMLHADDDNSNFTARIHPLRSYLTDFTAHRSDSDWNVFQLHSFEFVSDYRYDYSSIIYRDGKFYDAADPATEINSDKLSASVNGNNVTVKQTLIGADNNPIYTIDNYGDCEPKTTSDGSFTIDTTKGGAYVINANSNGAIARYILTIPYTTHKWKFGPDGTEPTMSDIQGKIDQYGSKWLFNARLKQADKTTGYATSYDHPVIAVNTVIHGDNILYVKNSEGLLFNSTSGSAFGYAIDEKTDYTFAALKEQKLTEKINQLKASTAYEAMTSEEKAEAEAAVVVTDQEINRILYNKYNYQDETTVENPTELWMGYQGSSFTIPYAKAGQYVKLHWKRYTGNNGEYYTVTNLKDLEGNDITNDLRISAYLSSTPYTDPKGNYIFQVANDGPVTFTMHDPITSNNGWVCLADVELTDIYSTDLDLVVINPEQSGSLYQTDHTVVTDRPLSLASNGMTKSSIEFSGYCGHSMGANANASHWKIEPDAGVTVFGETADHISFYGKFILSADNNSGNGNVKLTEFIVDQGGNYVVDKIESWIAVGTVTPQEYPRTWDFTAQNMDYATTSKTSMSATADSKGYGEWSTDSETEAYANKNITKDADMYLHTYNVEGGDKPLFANGSELTAGGATFPETIGIGVTAWDAESADNISLSGSALTGVKAISVPMLSAGDYVYVMASSAPTATVTAYTKTTTDGKSTYEEADGATMTTQDAKYLGNGVYGFKVGAGENVNMDITFGASTDVYKVGVSNIEKTFDKYGFSTESRDKNIDYSFISAPAYAITESEFTYNYDKVSVTPTETFGITPAGQGVMLYNDALAEDVSPLFYAGNNILTGTENLPEEDVTLAGQNQLVAQLEAGNIAQSQQNSEGLDCDAFVLTYIYSTYSQSAGGDIKENQDLGTDAFFRVKGSIAAPANKAYLLVESDKLPKALWDGGNGTGTAGAVKNVVRINFGEEDNDTPTAIEGINIADNENLKDATWYNLSGQKLNGMPATKGVYIVNGKKVMVK